MFNHPFAQNDEIFWVFALCSLSAQLFWAMFFLIIAYGPTSLPGLQALHAV